MNLRKEFIKEVMHTLKIEGVFNAGTIAEEISHISDKQLREFHRELFGTSHSYLNGMDRIIKVAESFKRPFYETDVEKHNAKRLIIFCESANNTVFENSKKSGRSFADEIKGTKFISLSESDIAILNSVKPYCSYKLLISNINHYQDSKTQLEAFIQALRSEPSNNLQISSAMNNLQIKRR